MNIKDGRKHSFTVVYNDIFDTDKLDKYEKLVYMTLCRFANFNSGACFPSQAKIAKCCGISIATVKRTLNRLILKGIILKRMRVSPNGSKLSNEYIVMDLSDADGLIEHSSERIMPNGAQLTQNEPIALAALPHSSQRAPNNTIYNSTNITNKPAWKYVKQNQNMQNFDQTQFDFGEDDNLGLYDNIPIKRR